MSDTILTPTVWAMCGCPHFTQEEAEPWEGHVTCPRVPSFSVAEPDWHPHGLLQCTCFYLCHAAACYGSLRVSTFGYFAIFYRVGYLERAALRIKFFWCLDGTGGKFPWDSFLTNLGYCVWYNTPMSYMGWLDRIFGKAVQEWRKALVLQRGSFKSPASNNISSWRQRGGTS